MSIAILNNRYERLIELNRQNDYVRNEKSKQYLRILLEIKKRKSAIWVENRKTNQKYAESVEKSKTAIIKYLTR